MSLTPVDGIPRLKAPRTCGAGVVIVGPGTPMNTGGVSVKAPNTLPVSLSVGSKLSPFPLLLVVMGISVVVVAVIVSLVGGVVVSVVVAPAGTIMVGTVVTGTIVKVTSGALYSTSTSSCHQRFHILEVVAVTVGVVAVKVTLSEPPGGTSGPVPLHMNPLGRFSACKIHPVGHIMPDEDMVKSCVSLTAIAPMLDVAEVPLEKLIVHDWVAPLTTVEGVTEAVIKTSA